MSTISVLIAEPSKTGRHIFKQLVDRLGVNVCFTSTAAETLVEANRQPFQMICLSQKLADDEGINVCAKLRKMDKYHTTIVLLVTPQKSTLNYEQAFSAGVTQLIGRHELHRFLHALELLIERSRPISGKVLVVEDSRAQAEYISVLLKSMGLDVVVVGSAEKALIEFKEQHFDLAMVDVVLAGTMTGVELVDSIRTLPEPKNRIRVLAMSAYEDSSRRVKLFNLGVDDFIIKPLVREELIARVRGLLSQHHIVATKQENERLANSLCQVIDNSPDMIARFDLDGSLLYMNPRMAEELGVEKEQLLGLHYSQIGLSPKTVDIYQVALTELIKSQSVVRYQLSGKNDIEFDIQFSPEEADGKIVSFISSARDITRISNLQKQLMASKQAVELASDAKSLFLATMSHELRTPLNAISGFTQLLKNKLRNDDISVEIFLQYLELINENTDNLTNLISDVLELSRIEAGKLSSHRQNVEISHLFEGIKAGFNSACEIKKIQFRVTIAPLEAEIVLLDKAKTLTILNNLIDNAIKFSHVCGEVTVQVSQQSGCLYVEVIDQGIGFPESFSDKLFSPFEQMDNSKTRDYGGTGLGLSIVSKFTEFLGGSIDISSVENKGTRCVLTLPYDEAVIEANGAEQQHNISLKHSTAPKFARFSGQKVLVVEDSMVNQRLMITCLETFGLNVNIAENGIEGIEKTAEWRPDIVLMDMHMPKMDGMEACKRLRQIDSLKQLPIFALSADVHETFIQKAFDAGINEYLTKPVDFNQLNGLIAKYLAFNIVDKDQGEGAIDVNIEREQEQSKAKEDEPMQPERVLNVEKGIAYAANNRGLYIQLLQTFVKQYSTSATELNELFQQANYDDAMKLAHTMKGVSATLGMDSLSVLAKKMQFAFDKQQLDGIEEVLAQFAVLLTQAIEEASQYCQAA